MSFASLKSSRKKSFSDVNKRIESFKNGGNNKDERLWKPTRDQADNGMAVIRFLPTVDGDDVPFVQLYEHFFKGPSGKFLVERCPTTLGDGYNCPVCENNRELWQADDKTEARNRKRKLKYYANIYVIEDSAKPENEGKVFLYEFGPKIFEHIQELMHPEFEDRKPVNPFDMWDGANFHLRIRKKDGFINYDKSSFATPSVLGDFEDEELEKIWKQEHSMKEYNDPTSFKTYDQLTEKLRSVIGGSVAPATVEDDDDAPWGSDEPVEAKAETPKKTKSKPNPVEESERVDDDEDDDMGFFAELAGRKG